LIWNSACSQHYNHQNFITIKTQHSSHMPRDGYA
jgi:hypothetical protein